MSERKKNFLLILTSLFIALLVGEIFVRMLRPKEIGRVVADPVLEFRAEGIPDFDKNGWHNASVLSEANIVTLGDSMTQGQGVESRDDAWPQALSRIASTSVYQMALGGYGPIQYAHLAKEATKLKPNILIIGFYFGNDLYDAHHVVYNFDSWKELRDPSFPIGVNAKVDPTDLANRNAVLAGAQRGSLTYYLYSLRLWIRNNIKLYALMGDATREARERWGLADTENDANTKIAELSMSDPTFAYVYDKDPRITTILSPVYRFDAINLDNTNTREGWRIAQGRFMEIKETLGTSTALVIVEIPTKEAVYLDLMQKREGKIPEQFVQYKTKEDNLQNTFLDFCNSNEIRCYSLRETMLAKLEAGEPVYKRIMDGHLPKEGYYAVAEGIYKYLKDSQLIK